jgi:hypothetical protein
MDRDLLGAGVGEREHFKKRARRKRFANHFKSSGSNKQRRTNKQTRPNNKQINRAAGRFNVIAV